MHTDHLRAFDRRIDQLLDQHPDAPIFLSFPGIGPIVAATLISEMGEDRDRFPTLEGLLAEAGLAPITKASGRTRQVRFRYAANRRMRHVIDWWVVRRQPGRPLVPEGLPDSPCPRPRQVPCPAWPRRPLDEDLVALLDQPHELQPRTPSQTRAALRLTPGSGTAAHRPAPQPKSRLAAGHPEGLGLDSGEDAATLRHARSTALPTYQLS